MKLKSKNLVLSGLLALLFFSSSISFGAISCKSILEKANSPRVQMTTETRAEDLLAIEILASLSLAKLMALGKYKTVPRIRIKDRGGYPAESYLFDKISLEDRAAILKDLRPRMLELVNGSTLFSKLSSRFLPQRVNLFLTQSHLRNEFNYRFGVNSIEGRLKRNEEYISNFLDRNLKAIIFNAASAPRRSRVGQSVLFLKRSFKYLVLGVFVGAGAEIVNPNIFFKEVPIDVVQDAFRYAVNEMPFWQKAGITGTALAAPARIVSVPVNAIRRFIRGWNNVDVDTFRITDYNSETGQEVRNNFVELGKQLDTDSPN